MQKKQIIENKSEKYQKYLGYKIMKLNSKNKLKPEQEIFEIIRT